MLTKAVENEGRLMSMIRRGEGQHQRLGVIDNNDEGRSKTMTTNRSIMLSERSMSKGPYG